MTDAVAQSIVVLDPDGRAISANRVALEYTGLSLEECRPQDFANGCSTPMTSPDFANAPGRALREDAVRE